MTIGLVQYQALYGAADRAIEEGDYDPHPECHVEFQKLAKPKLIRELCGAYFKAKEAVGHVKALCDAVDYVEMKFGDEYIGRLEGLYQARDEARKVLAK